MTPAFSDDLAAAKTLLSNLPTAWDGKASILQLKEADYNWRQMEWWGFYFEFLCHQRLESGFEIPGETFGSVRFDTKRNVNWDLKSKAIKSDDHRCILNDCCAIAESIERHGEHGMIIALCDVEYNDVNRTFQQWHTELKGGLSKYEVDRRARTSVSRYRKTRADLQELLFVRITKESLPRLGKMRQGRNSNGAPRPLKYTLDLEDLDGMLADKLVFEG